MDEKFEWLLLGWISGIACIIWAIGNFFRYGLWINGVFNFSPIVLLLVGIGIIIFTMVVVKHGDW